MIHQARVSDAETQATRSRHLRGGRCGSDHHRVRRRPRHRSAAGAAGRPARDGRAGFRGWSRALDGPAFRLMALLQRAWPRYEVLRSLRRTADLGEALSRARDPLADARDRALATDLATGTLRWRAPSITSLRIAARSRSRSSTTQVLDALRLGAYQLLYLERVPASAVVNDSVRLVKAAGFERRGFCQRRAAPTVARTRKRCSWPLRDSTCRTSRRRALAPAVARRTLDRSLRGIDGRRQWLRFNNEPPALTVRRQPAPDRSR